MHSVNSNNNCSQFFVYFVNIIPPPRALRSKVKFRQLYCMAALILNYHPQRTRYPQRFFANNYFVFRSFVGFRKKRDSMRFLPRTEVCLISATMSFKRHHVWIVVRDLSPREREICARNDKFLFSQIYVSRSLCANCRTTRTLCETSSTIRCITNNFTLLT